MLTHDEIMQKMILQAPFKDGTAAIDYQGGRLLGDQVILFTDQTVHPEFFNLLSASVVMYRTLSQVSDALEKMCEVAKANCAKDAMKSFQELATVINVSMLIATYGISVIANKLDEKELN